MPDRTLTVVVAGEPHQITLADSSTGSATAGAIVLVIPNNMPADQVRRGLQNAEVALNRDPQRINGI